MRALLPGLLWIAACGRTPEPRLLHDAASPDGRFRMRVVLRPDGSGGSQVQVQLESADGTGLRSDSLKIRARPEEIVPADFRATWVSTVRIEVTGWKTGRCISVWQLEDGKWMDRRSDEDRTLR